MLRIVLLLLALMASVPLEARSPRSAPARAYDADNTMGLEAGDILVDTASRRLVYAIDDATLRIYPVAVGRRGQEFRGRAVVGRMAEDPTWHPTPDQRKKKPSLPRVVRAGPANPLGTRALYLFQGRRDTLYRIHGTNEPRSIGRAVSSGCIRMRNADIEELYDMVDIGARVFVR